MRTWKKNTTVVPEVLGNAFLGEVFEIPAVGQRKGEDPPDDLRTQLSMNAFDSEEYHIHQAAFPFLRGKRDVLLRGRRLEDGAQ